MRIGRYLHYDINIFAAVMLGSVLLLMWLRRDSSRYSTLLLRRAVMATIVMLLVEIASWHFDRRPDEGLRTFNYAANALFFWLTPLVPGLWAAHIDFRLFRSRARLRRRFYYLHGMVLSSLLLVVNAFHPILFVVDATNTYSRLPGLWVIPAYAMGLLAYMIVLALRNRERASAQLLAATFATLLAPIIGSVVQLSILGALVIWPLMALTLTVGYVLLETVTSSRDYVTGLYNRQRVEEYTRRLARAGTPFGLALIDLDDFKLINDSLGHQAGDRYLQAFAAALSRVFTDSRMVGRFGGDEFVVVLRASSKDGTATCVDSLRRAIEERSSADIDPARLTFSIGFASHSGDADIPVDETYARADQAMYAQKAEHKNMMRRSTDRVADGASRECGQDQ